ncbi:MULTISPECIES: toprim domain-containing protein [Paenibacillus]|uniref:DNA primase n=1 Tax=Paenibacillus pabuli TaxID=1472 RepID=A0A855YH49_9BACL|nr:MULTISPECIES: toprim domain-containing protein [Paenibacillus]PWW43800.1 DNA primase [Paenibacillus pabuli]PXW09829.1 DNA primase [Paenibacillus taichungensis]RAI85708.1 DNA primase [Paenibacillus pabuli]
MINLSLKQEDPNIEILESLYIDPEELTDELRFSYQHLSKVLSNPKAFTGLNDTGEWVMSCCPLHSETRASFGISKEPPYHCNCFFCGYLGTIDTLIENALDLNEGEGIKVLLSTYIIEEEKRRTFDMVDFIDNRRNKYVIPHLEERVLTSMKDSRTSNELLYQTGINYMRSRGFNDRTLETYEICVDTATATIVFPQRTRSGELRFVQKRKIGNSYHGTKFINEGSAIKKDIIFGLHFINTLRTTKHRIRRVRMVESPIDCMSNYQVDIPAISINGRILFRNQIRELQLAGIEEIDLMLDNDKAGEKGMQDAAILLDRAGFVVNRVRYPSFPALKDSNELLNACLLDRLDTYNVNLIGSMFQ